MARPSTLKRLLVFCNAMLVLFVMGFSMASFPLIADSFTDRRTEVGLKLFKTLISADTKLEEKLASDNTFHIAVIYDQDEHYARELIHKLTTYLETLSGNPVVIQALPIDAYLKGECQECVAVFLSEKLKGSELEQLIAQSTSRHQILFSPFEGDVEHGVMAGISVESRIMPYINMQAMKASGLQIKPFYLKVAKRYE